MYDGLEDRMAFSDSRERERGGSVYNGRIGATTDPCGTPQDTDAGTDVCE